MEAFKALTALKRIMNEARELEIGDILALVTYLEDNVVVRLNEYDVTKKAGAKIVIIQKESTVFLLEERKKDWRLSIMRLISFETLKTLIKEQ